MRKEKKTPRANCPGRDLRQIEKRTARLEEGLDFVLNRVQANGRPGLENSLRDIYGEVKAINATLASVLEVTKSDRAWTEIRRAIKVVMKESAVFAILSNKAGQIFAVVLLVLVLNSLLHAVGVELNLQSFVRFLRLIP